MSYVRSWARTLFFAPLVLLSFSYPAHAAGSYVETFDSDPPFSWMKSHDEWAVTNTATNGYYANATTAPFRAIAFFSDRRWTTDFLYTLRMYSNLRGTGNHKVGAVFNYVDDMNYYEVAIDMRGDESSSQNVEVNQVAGGQRKTLAKGHSDVPIRDTWFDVAIMRIGTNRVRVRINNKDVLESADLTNPPVGYIGVLTQYNQGRFDDVKITPMFFRAGFGPGASIWKTPSDACDPEPTHGQKWQFDLIGTEVATNTAWPPAFWGAPTVVLMNTILGCNRTLTDYLDVRWKPDTILGPSNQVLSSTVKDATGQPEYQNQIGRLGLSYTVGDDGNVPFRFYVRRYLAYSSVLKTAMESTDGKDKWFVQQEFKNTTCLPEGPPRRLVIYLRSRGDGKPFYQLHMDQSNSRDCQPPVANETAAIEGFPDINCLTAPNGPCPALITGQWFYDEYFVQYSVNGSPTDRVAYYINGIKIFDRKDPIQSSKARGIKLTPGYLNISGVEVRADDLEVYADFPCIELPCGPPSHY